MDPEILGSYYKNAFEILQDFIVTYLSDVHERAKSYEHSQSLKTELKIFVEALQVALDNIQKMLVQLPKEDVLQTPEKKSKKQSSTDDGMDFSTDHSECKSIRGESEIKRLEDDKIELARKVLQLEMKIEEIKEESQKQAQIHEEKMKELSQRHEFLVRAKENELEVLGSRVENLNKEIGDIERKSRDEIEKLLSSLKEKEKLEGDIKRKVDLHLLNIAQLKREKDELVLELKSKRAEIVQKEEFYSSEISLKAKQFSELQALNAANSGEVQQLSEQLRTKQAQMDDLISERSAIYKNLLDNQDVVSANIVLRVTDIKTVINVIDILAQFENNDPKKRDAELLRTYIEETEYFQEILKKISQILLNDTEELRPDALSVTECPFFRKFTLYDEVSLEASRRLSILQIKKRHKNG